MNVEIRCAHKKMVALRDLIPNPRNPWKHSPKQIAALAAFIKLEGVRHPIIVSTLSGKIAAGHARYEAAKLLRMESYPVDYQDFTSEKHELAFLKFDNKIQELRELDENIDAKINEDLESLDETLRATLTTAGALPSLEENAPAVSRTVEDKPQFILVIECDSESVMASLFEEMKTRELKCRMVT